MKYFLIIPTLFCWVLAYAQTDNIDHHTQNIALLPQLNAQQLQQWQWAVEKQQGIIGNDFAGKEEIGTASLRRPFSFAKKWQLAWLRPYIRQQDAGKAYKQTLCGTINSTYHTFSSKMESVFFEDNDLSLHIIPDRAFDYMLREVPTIERTIECEIDMYNIQQMKYLKNGHTAHYDNDKVCVYGPWVNDVMHQTFLLTVEVGMDIEKKGHVEIHPREQTWWQKQSGDTTRYYCHLTCDESKRFFLNNRIDPYKGTNLGNWTNAPLKGTFALAFEQKPNSKPLQYKLYLTDSLQVQSNQLFYTHYTLSVAEQTVATVELPAAIASLFAVSFRQVGLDAQGNIKGFLVLEANVGRKGNTSKEDLGGHLMFWLARF
jgi:hypothetical protein